MNRIYDIPELTCTTPDISFCCMKFYEEGDWLRIVVPGRPDRFLSKKLASQMMRQIGEHSVAEKPDYVRRNH